MTYRPPITPERFYVAWTSCDGAGTLNRADEPYTLEDAIHVCNRKQQAADETTATDGAGRVYRNPWNYHHRVVDHRYQTVYRPGEPVSFAAA